MCAAPVVPLHSEPTVQILGLAVPGERSAQTDTWRGGQQLVPRKGRVNEASTWKQTKRLSEQAWKALEKVLPEDLYTTVHLTITPENAAGITDLIDKLDDFGVTSLSLSDSGPNLDAALEAARQQAADLFIDLEWDLPVPYSARNPVALELEEAEKEDAGPTEEVIDGAGRAWLYLEPDGDVLREQGRTTVLGNAMTDDWGEIWQKASGQ